MYIFTTHLSIPSVVVRLFNTVYSQYMNVLANDFRCMCLHGAEIPHRIFTYLGLDCTSGWLRDKGAGPQF